MTPLPSQPAIRLFVFSHPSHELAAHGLVRRLASHIVYLTDGGGRDRVDQTVRGLERMGNTAPVTWLDYPEKRFYDGLLDRDEALFDEVAARVREVVDQVKPDAVFCDAIEYYNPVHDMALPIVRKALEGLDDVPVFEIPLVYEVPGEPRDYRLQRAPDSRTRDTRELSLRDEDAESKRRARHEDYPIVIDQLGAYVDRDPSLYEHEEVIENRGGLPGRGDDVSIRYEWRGELLRSRGEVERVITHDGHWLPLARRLVGDDDVV